ncbi:helix-turn-helix transcriptional regulator [Kutzneria buriramensis]|uniref:helix-turn-helix domain-containing protein n=1 Tax=Kutzneria buriramensis TaxID=1045776 RepID=UPI001476BA2B|nr:helix-turn-helix transcriptional regulator [Kutzneria buriramensis]
MGRPSIPLFDSAALARALADAQISASELAKRLGIDSSWVRQWAGGNRGINAERLRALAAALGLTPDQLQTRPTNPTLAELRSLAAKTQAEVADEIGVARLVLVNWEDGGRKGLARPSATSSALGLSGEDLKSTPAGQLPSQVATKLGRALGVDAEQVQAAYAASAARDQ